MKLISRYIAVISKMLAAHPSSVMNDGVMENPEIHSPTWGTQRFFFLRPAAEPVVTIKLPDEADNSDWTVFVDVYRLTVRILVR